MAVPLTAYTYRKGITTGRAMRFGWADPDGALTDFSTGHTFAAYVVNATTPDDLALTKTTGITGSSGALGYNVVIDWAPADFTSLAAATYKVTLVATPSGGDPYQFPGTAVFILEAAPA